MKTALIIDDEEDIRSIARLSLMRVGGFSVREAADGLEGAAVAAEEKPDVILLDMMMPGMDGTATLHLLRGNPRTARIPVIFLTAKMLEEEIMRLRDLGAAGVITKPFNPMTLSADVQRILEAHDDQQ